MLGFHSECDVTGIREQPAHQIFFNSPDDCSMYPKLRKAKVCNYVYVCVSVCVSMHVGSRYEERENN